MTDFNSLPTELMAIHVAIQIFLDRYEDDAGPVIYDSMTELSENIIEGLRNEHF